MKIYEKAPFNFRNINYCNIGKREYGATISFYLGNPFQH